MKIKSISWLAIACVVMVMFQSTFVNGVEFGSKTRRLERSKQFSVDEKNEKKQKQSMLELFHDIGANYIGVLELLHVHVIEKIRSFLTLETYLVNMQNDFQAKFSGDFSKSQDLHGSAEDSINEMFKSREEFLSPPEHRSERFRLLTEQSLSKEREKNQFNARVLSRRDKILSDPLVPSSFNPEEHFSSKQDLNTENIKQNRSLQDKSSGDSTDSPQSPSSQNKPDDEQIITFQGREECFNNSKLVLVEQDTYFCNNQIVSEQYYNGLSEKEFQEQNCVTKLLKHEACYCRKDYIGRYCENETRILCDLEVVNQPKCPQMDEFAYVSKYSGIPPCVYIHPTDSIIYNMKINCVNAIPIQKEPIVYGQNKKNMKIIFDQKPPSASEPWSQFTNFEYFVDKDHLKISRHRLVTPQVQYINWNILGKTVKDSYIHKYNLTKDQLLGKETFDVVLNFNQLPKNMSTSGRYTVEINLFESFDKGFHYYEFALPITDTLMMTFEDITYIEPKKTMEINYWLVLLVLVLVGSLIYTIGATCVQSKRKQRKRQMENYFDDNMEQSMNQSLTDQQDKLYEQEDDNKILQ